MATPNYLRRAIEITSNGVVLPTIEYLSILYGVSGLVQQEPDMKRMIAGLAGFMISRAASVGISSGFQDICNNNSEDNNSSNEKLEEKVK